MKISLFKDWTIIYWSDYTYKPEVLAIEAVEQVEAKEAVLDEENNIIEEAVQFVEWVEWVPYEPAQWHPDCIFADDVDINIETQYVSVSEKKWKYKFIIHDKISQEIVIDKNEIFSRIKELFIEIQTLKFIWIDSKSLEEEAESLKNQYLSSNI